MYHQRTATPLIATATVAALSVALALAAPIGSLAKATSLATLVIFAMVNLALIRLRRKEHGRPHHLRRIPEWVAWAGLVTCLAMIGGAMFG